MKRITLIALGLLVIGCEPGPPDCAAWQVTYSVSLASEGSGHIEESYRLGEPFAGVPVGFVIDVPKVAVLYRRCVEEREE